MAPSLFGRRGQKKQAAATRPVSVALPTQPERAPFLVMLEPGLRDRVRKRLNRKRVGMGKALFQQDDPADDLYIVESGRFRVVVADKQGRERVLRFTGAGEVLGESAFMAETPHVTNAVAVENATVWRLSRQDFDSLIGKNESVLRYLASLISERQAQANARLAAESAPDEARALRGYVTAVFSPRGGAGTTTLAINLAIALAEQHPDDTVLLDLDVLFGHALSNLWLEPRGVLAQISPVTMQGLDRAGLDYYLLKHPSSLRILPAASRPEEGQSISGDLIRAAMTTLRRNFGHVVLDLPHDFSEVALAGLELANRVLMVATPEPLALRDVQECQRIFSEVLRMPPERVTYLLNHPVPYATAQVSEFTSATAVPWMEVPFGGEAPTAAALRGESLLTTRPNNPLARTAVGLAHRISRQAREVAALAGRSL